VATVDGRTVDLGSPQQRALLALLLIHPNRVIATDRILDQLWGDAAPGKENALWVYISRLRTLLEPDRTVRGESSYLLTSGHGYLLKADPESIDAVVFEREAAEGRRLINTDPAGASEVLTRALQRWRGSALEEFTYEDFARGEITRLEELHLSAVEDRVESELIAGQSRELIGELESLRESHPLRERLVAHQMLALYRTGRQADALRAFERFRRYLNTEVALEPSAELRRLEEQVLLQDPRLEERTPQTSEQGRFATSPEPNPYKGLRPFGEDDVTVFFGRERLVAEVMRRIAQGTRLLALVGPSGSGKSSVVRAGVIPAIRKGGPSGNAKWLVAQMVPGSQPFAELEAALLRSSLDAPATLRQQLEATDSGLLRAALRMLPDRDTRLLLVIDQFEELFMGGDDEMSTRFLTHLVAALDDSHGRVFVLITLRSDFYGHPLTHPTFGAMLGDGVINVVPLLPNELESAAERPAQHTGVSFEPALLGTLIADVAGGSGTLPLFQFALAELFDRRIDDILTLGTYREMGGVEGAVTRRAEDLYQDLAEAERKAARQLFLRLVAIADGGQLGRRRVLASEITTLDVDLVALQQVIDAYTRNRLLTLDRDHVSDSPTVEVSHEALLTQWTRLRQWIEGARDDIRRRAALHVAMSEWEEADRAPDYLLAGSRLQVYEEWASKSAMQLTAEEHEYLRASVQGRTEFESAETQRRATERRLAASAKRRLWALASVLLVAITAAGLVLAVAVAPEPASVAVLMPNLPEEQEGLTRTGTERAERELGVRIQELTGRFTDLESTYRNLAASGTDLIFIDNANSGWQWVEDLIADNPDTAFAVVNGVLAPAGARSVYFADEQAGYLAGVAGALSTKTGVVGFVGNYQSDTSERWRAGFEAGARAVGPDVEVQAIYIGAAGIRDPDAGRTAADEMFRRDADVVLAFAGDATPGVIEAAFEQFQQSGVHRWVIGSESDWSIGISTELRPHVLTSVIRQWDVAVFDTIRRYVEGEFTPGITVLGLDVGAVALTRSAHLSTGQLSMIEDLSTEVGGGRVTPGAVVSDTVTVTWDGRTCTYADGSGDLGPGQTIRVDLVNDSSEYRYFFTFQSQRGIQMSTLVQPNTRNTGYITLHAGSLEFRCGSEIRDRPRAEVADHTETAHTLTIGP
jgi:basic membrane lipoprotein Med (substrate-binding protein (PBP1-ABC) superfamily)/DNA-binding SARP family transcriptional activator